MTTAVLATRTHAVSVAKAILPARKAVIERFTRMGPQFDAANRQRSGRVHCANGEPVHRAARERRQVDGRTRRLGKHVTRRLLELEPLPRERRDAREDEALGLRQSQKLNHDRAYRTRGG